MSAHNSLKTIGAVCVAALVVCWLGFLANLYRTDPAFFLSRIAYDWRDPGFAAFHRLYARINVGMTRKELQQVIEEVYPLGGSRKPPRFHVDEPTQIILFYSGCEGIMLTMSNGRIVSKGYSPD